MTGPAVPRGAWVAAAALVGVLVAVAGRYGYHRDEYYFLEGGHHLGLGQPDNPVGVPLLTRVWSGLVGDRLWAFRILPALASGATVVLGALTCRALGGSRHATLITAVGTACMSIVSGTGHLFSTTTFDLTLTVAALLLLVRALDQPGRLRRWLALGLVVGVDMEVKVLVAVSMAAALTGLLVLGPRRPLLRSGPVLAAGIALVLAAPYLVWQARHGWPMLAVATGIAAGGSTSSADRGLVVPLSLLLMGPLICLVALLGLITSLRSPQRQQHGWIGLGYLVLLTVVVASGGKPYYLAGWFPALLALGAQPLSRWLSRSRRRERGWWVAVAVVAVPTAVFSLPLSPVGSLPFRVAAAVNPDGAETVGWPSYVATVAQVAATLPPEQRSDAVVLAHNYGEAGAAARARRISRADAAALPPVYSGHNAFGEWGPPPDGATTVVVVGELEPGQLDSWFTRCDVAAHLQSPPGVDNEEDGVPVAVCTGLRRPWAELWPSVRRLA